MDYDVGIRLDLINEKLDLLLKKAYPNIENKKKNP